MDDVQTPATIASTIQRLNSYASSSSSSGVVTNFASKSLSQNLSCDSSRSNFSTFESLDLNLSDCSELASSLPSCASGNVNEGDNKEEGKSRLMFSSSNSHSDDDFFSFLSSNPINICKSSMCVRVIVRKNALFIFAQ